MAVKWAVANGNWNAGTTWNDGVVPNNSDDVYLNGCNVVIPATLSAKSVHNDECPNTGIIGGRLRITATGTYTLTAGAFVFVTGTMLEFAASRLGLTLTINGNIALLDANLIWFSQTGAGTWSTPQNYLINGNISTNALLLRQENTAAANLYFYNLTINGFYETSYAQFCNNAPRGGTINVYGILRIHNVFITTTVRILGGIEYSNSRGGISANNITFLDASTFTWKDISEQRTIPFIIVTDADMNNSQQYPPEDEVKAGSEYVWGEKVGTYQQPPESVVLKGYRYDNDEKEGTLENENIVGCVTPEDVRKDVLLVGMGVVGSLVVPSVDDVREGVIFDNGSVGTLIVQGGGERLRIADFGYYTNAQSDTYIVDLTEQDKPKFAVAEERVLIEMFPDLDLDNIPDKYFDDLFVKYLKYRLIVEYYRTAGINSTFTPSEPTTEIVNYQNVRNEVWLNSANIYLKAWSKKYPESIVKPQRILL